MAHGTTHDRVARKAHELWESEGRPHGREQVHWDEAKEIVALEDSMDATLLPRDTGASEPEEPAIAITNQGEMPNLADQGPDDLTSIDREPAVTKTKGGSKKDADKADRERSTVAVTGKGSVKAASKPASVTKGKSGKKG